MARLYTDHTFKASDGIEIFYTDSGAPSTVDYTTLVVLHGSAFNGDGLVGLHEHAHKNNLRVVLWNRRDYRGSTKYTDAELKDLHEGRKVFQDRLALQLAEFFQYFIKHENTPALTADRKAGGFILMGWSFGNATTLSLLSDSAVIPKGIYNMIEPYIMSLVMYDPPYTALGYILPDQEKYYDPWTDPDYPTPEQLYDNFQQWVSSYYTHKNIGSGNREEMSFEKRTEKRTVAGWTEEQKEKYFDKVAAVRTELPSYAPPMQALLKVQTQEVLFNESLVASHFPKVNIFYISGMQTCYYCMWAYMVSSGSYNKALALNSKARPTKFRLVEGGNHFLHYDLPDLFLKEIVVGCRNV